MSDRPGDVPPEVPTQVTDQVPPQAPGQVPAEARGILDFWFSELQPADWFRKDPELDRRMRERLGPLHERAAAGAFDARWPETPEGALALLILYDQASRNLYRDDPRAYAWDAQALALARHALEAGHDLALAEPDRRLFFYLPFQHSEALADQDLCCRLCAERIGNARFQDYAERHRDVIRRFGRFPHRNAVLGRPSTPEEEAYLAEPGAGF